MKLSTLSRASSVCSWFPSVGSLARSFSATVLVGDAVDEDLGRSRRPESVTVLTFVDSAVVDSTRRWWRCRRWWGGPRRRCQRSFTVTVTSFGDDVGRSRRRKRCWSEMVLEMELEMEWEMEVGDGVGYGVGDGLDVCVTVTRHWRSLGGISGATLVSRVGTGVTIWLPGVARGDAKKGSALPTWHIRRNRQCRPFSNDQFGPRWGSIWRLGRPGGGPGGNSEDTGASFLPCSFSLGRGRRCRRRRRCRRWRR